MEIKHQVKPTPIDYTNLYIKNLDLDVQSMDLFTHFRTFGSIVSARVMRHPYTNQSRGFGFVSFSRMEDAVMAKEKMNGQRINTKSIMVAFHEPKKMKEDYPPNYSEKRMREENLYKHVPEKMNKYTHTLPLKRQISAPIHHAGAGGGAGAGAGGGNSSNGLFVPVYSPRGLRRSGSAESMATTTTANSSHLKRQAIIRAILQVGEQQENNMQDIVDMLLTLKRKDLATCLFNKTFLKGEIQRAKEALDLFKEEKHELLLPNIKIPPRCSQAIPIVAPTDAGDKLKKESDAKDSKDEVEKFLESLKNLTLYEQKQMLGDRLFPLVKATGVKHAPRVTIRLLDSISIFELAHLMYNRSQLKSLVEKNK
ncbi:hypothetical protein G6F56_004271 [Rhizopus delemar]|nr:hypothetical protein G6F56_004271 [Rhizopus delemar]